MTTIIGVRFKSNGKMYYFDPQDTEVTAGTGVIVETARGLEYGECVQGNTDVPDQSVVQPLKRVVRVATETDMKTLERNSKRADEAFLVCKRKIEDRGLEMNLVTAECTFDMNKLLFYFTADGRVDFRELVKDLASVFRTRIELRQIGVRDEAKMIGGLGCCGRELCCSTYLDDFHPVSINMAKGSEPFAQSGEDFRCVRPSDVLPEIRARSLRRAPEDHAASGQRCRYPRGPRQGHHDPDAARHLQGAAGRQSGALADRVPVHAVLHGKKGACRNRQNAAAMAEERRKREDQEDAAAPAPKKDAPKKSETPHQKPQQPRPPRKPAPQQTAGDELPEDAQNELSPDGEGAPRRRRRRGGRRRRKPNGEKRCSGTEFRRRMKRAKPHGFRSLRKYSRSPLQVQ